MAEQLFGKIKQESTRVKVCSAIREAILTGKLKTGQRITEVQLATDFNVSRAVVREALQQLTHEGLLEQNSYKGTRVLQLSARQVDEIISLRVLLEAEAVRAAKARITEADKKTLRSWAAKLEGSKKNYNAHAELDLGLHEKIWELAGNETLSKLLAQVTVPLFAMGNIVRHSKVFVEERTKTKIEPVDHTLLVEKICDGSVKEAVAAIQSHVTHNWKHIREYFEEFIEREREGRLPKSSTKKNAA